jgi:protein involved in polysaccharide export with SLBB domain
MKVPNNRPILLAAMSILFASMAGFAQIADTGKRNNPYSPSPRGKSDEKQIATAAVKTGPIDAVFVMQNSEMSQTDYRPIVARQSVKNPTIKEPRPLLPSEIYKVGVGDVLFVNLKNSAQGSSYCTVRPDGKIDFPLAGDELIVAGQTVDTIKEIITSGITLFSDPQIEVTVREYASHKITVSGMVETPGERNLQREAMPLFAIRSEAVVSPKATKAVVKRAPLLKLESYDLRDPATDSVLIYPGNSIEFTSDNQSNGTYYVTGDVNVTGKRELASDLTLYQAVIASGIAKGEPKKATIRRKSDNGLFANTDYNLRAIKDGKSADPLLESGDVIEIRK